MILIVGFFMGILNKIAEGIMYADGNERQILFDSTFIALLNLLLKNWKYYREDRIWGTFYNLFEDGPEVKVKELIVHPGKGMSFQKHFKRSEIWMVSKGSCIVNFSKNNPNDKQNIKLNKFDHYLVPLGQWHQITNPFDEECHLIEIQYGKECVEDDIERTEYYSAP